MNPLLRNELGGHAAAAPGRPLLSLLHLSDAHVLDAASPARCEWAQLLAGQARWRSLLPMHRPQEALTHWALAAHVERLHRDPIAPWSRRPFDLALCTGDNIDNAQHNEFNVFLKILCGGRTWLSAFGSPQDASAELGPGPWPFWCPDPTVEDLWKPLGYPAVPDFLQRASAEVHSKGLGFALACLPGNHDLLRQGTALPDTCIERIAVASAKTLRRPADLNPEDPLALFVEDPGAFSQGITRHIDALPSRRALDRQQWLQALFDVGAAGVGSDHVKRGCADLVIDTESIRLILLDTNHPQGDFEGSLGAAQLAWLEERLAEVDRQSGRYAVLGSHHGSSSLTNTRGDDPERKQTAALLEVLHRHRCLIAWLVGHRHRHRVRPHPGPNGGFWEITTGSIIDWPSQTRAIEFLQHPDQIEIVCTVQDHGAEAGSLAALHLELARRVAGDEMARDCQGSAADGNVRLLRPAPRP